MIRLTLRQFRTQALVALGLLVVVAVVLAITGPRLSDLIVQSGTVPRSGFYGRAPLMLDWGLLAVPALIGMFWGAPLVARELETGTFRLAWTQSVTRTRWLAVKLGLLGLSSMIIAGLFSLMVTWWSSPIDTVNLNRFDLLLFGERAIAPIGYAVFAFTLGVTLGVLIRRVVPAMAATIVAFIAVRLGVTYLVRPHLWAPSQMSLDFKSGMVDQMLHLTPDLHVHAGAEAHIPDAWVYSAQLVDKAGHVLTNPDLGVFPDLGTRGSLPDPGRLIDKIAETYHVLVTYQPAARYWAFQAGETAVFVGLALILAGFCFWWVRRRLS